MVYQAWKAENKRTSAEVVLTFLEGAEAPYEGELTIREGRLLREMSCSVKLLDEDLKKLVLALEERKIEASKGLPLFNVTIEYVTWGKESKSRMTDWVYLCPDVEHKCPVCGNMMVKE